MPDAQLLVKTIIFDNMPIDPQVIRVKFHLSRGMIARILGFNVKWTGVIAENDECHVTVVKSINHIAIVRDVFDQLWGHSIFEQASFQTPLSMNYTLPKPYRTTGVAVQAEGVTGSTINAVLNIYYDVDDMTKDEEIAILETTSQKGRRAL